MFSYNVLAMFERYFFKRSDFLTKTPVFISLFYSYQELGFGLGVKACASLGQIAFPQGLFYVWFGSISFLPGLGICIAQSLLY